MGDHGASTEFGKDLGLVHEAVVRLRKYRVGRDFWAKIAHGSDMLVQRLIDTVMSLPGMAPYVMSIFGIEVDETQTVEEVVASGDLRWSDDNITSENFPRREGGRREEKPMAIFCFGAGISSKEIIAEMDKEGFCPATIWDLGGVAKVKPGLQRNFPIVALGSVAVIKDKEGNDKQWVAQISCHEGGRYMDLDSFDGPWAGWYRFLAIPKPVPAS